MKIKQGIPENLREIIILWSYKYFKNHIPKEIFSTIVFTETNWDISAMLVDDDDDEDVFGVYLLGNSQLNGVVDRVNLDTMTGVEGVLLVVDDKIRGMGFGNQLKDFPKTLGVDYIWGQQLKSLENLNHWLKRRDLIYETNEIYITAEFFIK